MIDILYEDNHLIAINKKSGYLVQGDKTKDKPLSEFVKDYIKIKNKTNKLVRVGETTHTTQDSEYVVVGGVDSDLTWGR